MRTGGKGKTMTDLLVKLFIKNADQISSPKVPGAVWHAQQLGCNCLQFVVVCGKVHIGADFQLPSPLQAMRLTTFRM